MSELRLHSVPSRSSVAGEQFRMLVVSLRNVALLFTGAMALGTAFMLAAWWRSTRENINANLSFELEPELVLPLIVAGFFLPLAVWKDEDPSRRGYHWAMPVARGPHSLTRSFFGWVCFLSALIVYLLWLASLNAAFSTEPGLRLGSMESWQWLVPFFSVTIAYLLGTTLVLASDHPWRWFVGIPVGALVVTAFAGAADIDSLRWTITQAWVGPWGLVTALSGTVPMPEPVTLADGSEVMRFESRPNLGAWTGATALWLGIGIAGTITAAFRHQER